MTPKNFFCLQSKPGLRRVIFPITHHVARPYAAGLSTTMLGARRQQQASSSRAAAVAGNTGCKEAAGASERTGG